MRYETQESIKGWCWSLWSSVYIWSFNCEHQGETTLESRLVAEGGARGSREYKRLVLSFWSSVCAWSFNSEHLDRRRVVEYKETNQP